MDAREMSNQEKESLAGNVLGSLGEPEGSENEIPQSHELEANPNNAEEPDLMKALSSAKKRLKAQNLQHAREMRDVHSRMADMESKFSQKHTPQATTHYDSHQVGHVDEQIHKAVSYALQHREMEERKTKETQHQVEMQKQYKDLYKHLDSMGDKYDDYHDTVFNDESNFTPTMRDYALTLPKSGNGSAGEVLYHLGKNPEELDRISKLPPARQAQELSLLSHALIKGGEAKSVQPKTHLGQIKNNPVSNSHVITDKTPVASIRERMKSGTWK